MVTHYSKSMDQPSKLPVLHVAILLYLQPMIPPKRFDIFSLFPLTGGCSEGLGAF